MITAVLDVNVLVAAVLAPHGTTRQVLAAWEANRFQSLTSEGIVAEVEEKLRSPRIDGRYGVYGRFSGLMSSLSIGATGS